MGGILSFCSLNVNNRLVIVYAKNLQPPPQSSRPPVTGYSISHNTTGSMHVNKTKIKAFTVEDVYQGVYCFSIWASNVVGDGEVTSTGMHGFIFTILHYTSVLQ